MEALFDKLEGTVLPRARDEGRDQQGRCRLHLAPHDAPLCRRGLSELRGLVIRITDQLVDFVYRFGQPLLT